MARDFGPFPSKPMYEVVNRRMQRALAEATASTGFAKTGQGAVTAGTGAELVIAAYPDGALVDGLYVENPDPETVTVTTNTASTNPRIDRLVMRLDVGAETIAPFQIVGTPAASPSAPPLVRTATVSDMPLCQYRFPGSASAQNPGSIVDERVLTALVRTGNNRASLVAGTNTPPDGAPLVTRAFSAVVTTNATGNATVTLPDALPTGILSVICTPGDTAANLTSVTVVLAGVNKGAFNVLCRDHNGAVIASAAVRINVIAVGW